MTLQGSGIKVSLVVPVFNEEDVIAALFESLEATIKRVPPAAKSDATKAETRMDVRSRVLVPLFVLLALFVITSVVAVNRLNRLGDELEELSQRRIPMSGLLSGLVTATTTAQREQAIYSERLVWLANQHNTERFAREFYEESLAEFAKLRSVVRAHVDRLEIQAKTHSDVLSAS